MVALTICNHREKGNHRGFAPTLFENELHHIREYIVNNPAKWELDRGEYKIRPYIRQICRHYNPQTTLLDIT